MPCGIQGAFGKFCSSFFDAYQAGISSAMYTYMSLYVPLTVPSATAAACAFVKISNRTPSIQETFDVAQHVAV